MLRRKQCSGGSNDQEGEMFTRELFFYALSLEGVFWEGVLEILSRRYQIVPYIESAVGGDEETSQSQISSLNCK